MINTRRYLKSVIWFLVLAGYLLFTPSAYAHVQQGQAVSFVTGLEHPWSDSTMFWP